MNLSAMHSYNCTYVLTCSDSVIMRNLLLILKCYLLDYDCGENPGSSRSSNEFSAEIKTKEKYDSIILYLKIWGLHKNVI